MIGASFLKRTLEDSVRLETAARKLRAADSVRALVDTWFEQCDREPEGPVRDALREVYTDCLVGFAPMARAG